MVCVPLPLLMILFKQYCVLDTATNRRDAERMSFNCQLFGDLAVTTSLRCLELRLS